MSKILGIHKVIFYRKKGKMRKKVYFCIMDNIFNTGKKIDLRYDLKGSTYGRRTIGKSGIQTDRTIALKDLDFINKKDQFKVGLQNKKRLLDIIKLDCEFFQ